MRLRRTENAWWLLAVLTVGYILSFADRQFLAVAVEPVRLELGLSDVELGLLTGAAFAICYSVLGVPMGVLSDRVNRIRLVAACILVWSLATIACGLARTLPELFAARMMVGVGEAGLLPAAYSLLGQRFRAGGLAQAVGIFVAGGALGSGLAVLAGGPLIDLLPERAGLESWRQVFIGLGLAGIPVSLLVLTMREPERKAATSSEAREKSLWPWLRSVPCLALLTAAACLLNIMLYGLHAWAPAFFQRVHGWSATELGVSYGLALLVCGMMAGPLWGRIGVLVQRYRGDMMILLAFGAVLPLAVLVPIAALTPSPWVGVAVLGGMPLLSGAFITIVPATIVALTPAELRGRVMAIFFMLANLIGIGGGPLAYAWIAGAPSGGVPNIAFSMAILPPLLLVGAAMLFLTARPSVRAALHSQSIRDEV